MGLNEFLPKKKIEKLVRVQALIPKDIHAKVLKELKARSITINEMVGAAFNQFLEELKKIQ